MVKQVGIAGGGSSYYIKTHTTMLRIHEIISCKCRINQNMLVINSLKTVDLHF
jgi:hypothetical protein